MSNCSHLNDEFSTKKAIDEIGKRYMHLDGQYAGVTQLPANNGISPNGYSLLDDIEFFLTLPGVKTEIEKELFDVLQLYVLKYLRILKIQAGSDDG